MNTTETSLIPDKDMYALYKAYYENKAHEPLNVEQYYLQHAANSQPILSNKVGDSPNDNKLFPLGPNFSSEENQTYANFVEALSKGKLPPPGSLPSVQTASASPLTTEIIDKKLEAKIQQNHADALLPNFNQESTSPTNEVRQNKGDQNLIHEVSPTDTLEGIVIKYGVSKDAIRMANDFSGEEVWMRKILVIPKTKGPLYQYIDPKDYNEIQKLYAIDMLIIWIKAKYKDQKSYSSEAKYYLELHNYDLHAAFKDFEDDIEFENQAVQSQKGFIMPDKGKRIENKKMNNYESQALLNKKKK